MNKERARYFAGLMEEYLNIPSFVCENIENELINEKYNKVINYVIDRRKELENKANYKTHQEIINMYLELQQEKEQLNSLVNSCQEEIRELKKQLEEANTTLDTHNELIEYMKNQQKEFIDWLENEKNIYPYDISDYTYEDIINTILSKYEEIIEK